jgi:hypothetical protein
MSPAWLDLLNADPIPWLLASNEPWTRYRMLRDLLDRGEDDPDVQTARHEMLTHPQVADLMRKAAAWGDRPLKRHNDASHPIYALSTLADFGFRVGDSDSVTGESILQAVESVLSHQAPSGAFQTLLQIPVRFGGSGEDTWSWMACDAPTLLYALLAFGLGGDPRVRSGVGHLVELVHDNGWRCAGGTELGHRFRGPGRKGDPCPIANVYALKALSLVPQLVDSPATRFGVEMLLGHWERQAERKLYLFGIGTDFRKPKYPFVWYDILHVVDILSRFPFARSDARLQQMVGTITAQADSGGRFTARSMYRAWRGWSFADKKTPSPWLTFVVLRALKRVGPGNLSEECQA